MAQKDKVKELVGRGLDSYHTKALQQMDRIEKKNKEQNHKISILTNELDNDYLTKTEEGSVVSLEHSKEGMVYLDELQGNTLVNYCTDGSKEMTLNGDIDVEGTFVTTTEGVDNGKVDVMCEGNTLVNLATIKSVTLSNTGSKVISNLTFKQDTKYTLIFDVDSNSVTNESHEGIYLWFTVDGITPSTVSALDLKGRKKYVMTRSDNANGWGIGCRNDLSGTVILNNILILEGDWTDREVPSYFEGMKSVGQDDTNGHKIEILSQNKDFVVNGFEGGNIDNSGNLFNQISYLRSVDYEHCVPNTEIIASYNEIFRFSQFFFYDKNKSLINRQTVTRTVVPNNARYFKLVIAKKDGTEVTSGDINSYANKATMVKLYTQSAVYVEPKSNKKEILMNEPLRGLPNGVRDRFVKIGGKWFIERNIEERKLLGSEFVSLYTDGVYTPIDFMSMYTAQDLYEGTSNLQSTVNIISDKLPSIKRNDLKTTEYNAIVRGGKYIAITTRKTDLETQDVEGFKKYVDNLNLTFQHQKSPTYEPIIDPVLLAYLDITHISNNSIIPCNMKIQNSGYNAIIKPSTLYTVALGTNKSGTIGINLGGAKGTTTNNVLTLTTPATLSDDSLRLYGKGIKGSKVRLLEGDKTNWIPSYFEGMKSSFEDKLQDDGTYKMEILSTNKNLFNGTWVYDERNNKINSGDLIKVKPNTTYTISDNLNYRYQIYEYVDKNTHFNSMYPYAGSYTFTTSKRTHYLRFSTYAPSTDVNVKFLLEEGRNVNSYEPNKSNKIQFSSIKPLRSLPNGIKDKFIFKDEKLMIERNCGEIIFDGSEIWLAYNSEYNINNIIRLYTTRPENSLKPNDNTHINYMISDKLFTPSNGLDASSMSNNLHSFSTYISYGTGTLSICLPKSVLSSFDEVGFKEWLSSNTPKYTYQLAEPIYEEIPFELQKIILEGYENGTLFFDTNIPPTSTVTYAGETPIVKSAKSNRVEVASNTTDINDNIIPYLCDMDYRIVVLELQQGQPIQADFYKLFGGVYEMLKRDILSKRLSKSEYEYRLTDYFNVGKLTEQQVRELEDLINE